MTEKFENIFGQNKVRLILAMKQIGSPMLLQLPM
jgi:hypothetical protein